MKTFRALLVCSTAAATLLALGTGLANATPNRSVAANYGGLGSRPAPALYVSPGGSAKKADRSCSTARFTTIAAAITAAAVGQKVEVCAGIYHEAVVVPKALELDGHGAVINAAGALDANNIPVPGILVTASHVKINGFTVENSTGEGILAMTIPGAGTVSGVTIDNNVVKHNDLGTATSAYLQCQAAGAVPGDCGEGLHLMGVVNSFVTGNNVSGNSGGILLTDETGPNHGNLVANNWVHDNLSDCGVTLPSHVAGNGVYNNVVRANVITGNGLLADGGSGIQLASAGPDMGSHDNLVIGNYIAGNGHGGVTIHAHAPGQNVNGNKIIGNWIGRNNIAALGDTSAGDAKTTGIIVFSAVVPVAVTIHGNIISDNTYGIWLSSNVSAPAAAQSNLFYRVAQKVHVAP